MIRKQIYLPEEMDLQLNKLAEERGIAQAEIIRESLARYLSDSHHQEDVWGRFKQKMMDSNYADLTWNRAELHAQRFSREES